MVLLDLMGGVALLLWGLHMVHSGILRAFGPDLRQLLSKALNNRFTAFAAGLGLTALFQSSTATALITSSFTAEGLVSLVPALAIMLGANVGTTLIVQVLSFNIAAVAPVLFIIGLVAFRSGARSRIKDLGRVSDSLFAGGAGRIGEYSECSYRLAGTGTFFGSDASNPTVGIKGQREEVSEWRLEAVCPASCVEAVVAAIRQAHSYEEPAFDLYLLHAPPSRRGEGRLGSLEPGRSLAELAAAVKATLRAGPVQTIGDLQRPVRRVAIVCGAGGEFLADAVRARADVLLTGEMRFHDYLSAGAQGLALILPGHYATERCGIEELADRLRGEFPT